MNGEGQARTSMAVSILCLLVLPLLAGCQAFGGSDANATISADLTLVASESASIRAAATAEQQMVIETIVAGGTRISRLAAINAALGATLRAHQTGTPEVSAVVVSADDMGSSLEDDMLDNEALRAPPASAMTVSDISTAASLDPDSGCSTGTVRQFRPGAERIYVSAEVAALQIGTLFEVDWRFNAGSLYSGSWLADFSSASVCVWFYATPVDFPFLPGNYSATLYADGVAQGTTDFSIANE